MAFLLLGRNGVIRSGIPPPSGVGEEGMPLSGPVVLSLVRLLGHSQRSHRA
ncbi:hypothetical protein [Microbacterium sp. TNHR37B]|uniref:hypothetical protein n=1 Tax=Microbacterium sp. TNHR37B TaxID=1775956 RepID=UPI0012F7E877|nr:hypothetical protein [Microbacterium sp. TNHR37B]